jgi:hypothetical protein
MYALKTLSGFFEGENLLFTRKSSGEDKNREKLFESGIGCFCSFVWALGFQGERFCDCSVIF